MTDNPSLTKQTRTESVDRIPASNKRIKRLLRVQKVILMKRVKNLSSQALRKSCDSLRLLGVFDGNFEELNVPQELSKEFLFLC